MLKDLTLILPSIRPHLWDRFFRSFVRSVRKHTYTIIIVGPVFPENKILDTNPDVIYLKSYSPPTRCAQIAALLAHSKYLCWVADDGIWFKNSLSQCIGAMNDVSNDKDFMCMRYYEGVDFSGNDRSQPIDYWMAHHHPTLRLPGIPKHYKLGLSNIYHLDYFRQIGGFDCRYEQLNMSTHDLAFRAQNDGGVCHLSPNVVISYDWIPDVKNKERIPFINAHEQNDWPLFRSVYSKPHNPDYVNINYDNWKDIPDVWERRWSKKTCQFEKK